ncbi:hypothetical protein PG993_012349 [Apiospora rasikravindrae]|uniref:Uncharacterized protein n=1 Tax=Apiospora rasikravindrae TaxID=990691 RepID=A0ABR1S2B6_9PEZI
MQSYTLVGDSELPDNPESQVNTTVRGDCADTPEPENLQPEFNCRSKLRDSIQEFWLLELLAVLLGVGCMVAMVVVAIHSDNTLVSDWSLLIGINALFSVLVTISKAAMLLSISECIGQIKWLYLAKTECHLDALSAFDDASRGPWGSLLFLSPWSINVWPQMARLGEFLTLVAMVVGPFAQQTVDIRTERMSGVSGANSSLLFTTIFDTGDLNTTDVNSNDEFKPTFLDERLQGAFFNGIFALGSNFQYTCTSGNCTWPSFTSLAMCSKCTDVTERTQVVEIRDSDDVNYIFTTPGGFVLPIVVPKTSPRSGSHMLEVAGNATIEHTPLKANETVNLITLAIIQFRNKYAGGNKTIDDRPTGNWTATECIVSWCMKKFESVEVFNGALKPFIVKEMPLWPSLNQNLSQGAYEKVAWHLVPRITSFEDEDLLEDGNRDYRLGTSGFTIVNQDHATLSEFMGEIFTFRKRTSDNVFSVGSALGYGRNVSAVIANMTESMTHGRRSGRGATQLKGTMWHQEATVHIKWFWLTLPIAFVLLSTLFFLNTVMDNAQHYGIPLWKSSMWPLVFQGLEDWSEQERRERKDGSLREVKDMEKRAKKICVQLHCNGLGAEKIGRTRNIHPPILFSSYKNTTDLVKPHFTHFWPAQLLPSQRRQFNVTMVHNPSDAQPVVGKDSSPTEIDDTTTSALPDLSPRAQTVVRLLRNYIRALEAGDPTDKLPNYHEFTLSPEEFNALRTHNLALLEDGAHAWNYFPSLGYLTIYLSKPAVVHRTAVHHITQTVCTRLQSAISASLVHTGSIVPFANTKFEDARFRSHTNISRRGVQTTSVFEPDGTIWFIRPSTGLLPACWVQFGWYDPAEVDKVKAAMMDRLGRPHVSILINLACSGPVPSIKDAIVLDILRTRVQGGFLRVTHDVCGVDVRTQNPATMVGLCLSDFGVHTPEQPVQLWYGDIVRAVENAIRSHLCDGI